MHRISLGCPHYFGFQIHVFYQAQSVFISFTKKYQKLTSNNMSPTCDDIHIHGPCSFLETAFSLRVQAAIRLINEFRERPEP
jgi:hypothetical protein